MVSYVVRVTDRLNVRSFGEAESNPVTVLPRIVYKSQTPGYFDVTGNNTFPDLPNCVQLHKILSNVTALRLQLLHSSIEVVCMSGLYLPVIDNSIRIFAKA
jgi:hypothetical protein